MRVKPLTLLASVALLAQIVTLRTDTIVAQPESPTPPLSPQLPSTPTPGINTTPIYKLDPRYSLSLGGFDRRGAAASLTSATAHSFKVTGVFSDLADFATLYIHDADDRFGHLQTSKYLPDFDMTGIVLDFDLSIVNGFYPGSSKFPSVPWNALSWIKADGTQGSSLLSIQSTGGLQYARRTYKINGSPVAFDRVNLVFLGNVVYDYVVPSPVGAVTPTTIAANLAAQINASTSPSVPIKATSNGPNLTVVATQPGVDGNTIELIEMHKTGTTYITPAGATKLTGGVDPISMHIQVDFTSLGLTSLRQAWLTLAPPLPINSSAGNYTLQAFTAEEFSYTFSNWVVKDPSGHTPLKIAGPGSVLVSSSDARSSYSGSGWAVQDGVFYHGFSKVSHTAADSVIITYSSQYTHDLYLGTSLYIDRGIFNILVDGIAQPDLDTYLNGVSSLQARRIIASNLSPGSHTITLTVSSSKNGSSSGYNCYFDYLQAAVKTDVQSPALYSTVNAAWDFDTDQTYKISPYRAWFISRNMGFTGDLDLYAGVFFALKRIRVGGFKHTATVTLSGTWNTGTGFGDGDAIFMNLGGTLFGAAVFPADTNTTLAQRFVDAVNSTFVGVYAAPGSAGVFTITTTSPINGFTFAMSVSGGATGSQVTSGDIGAGNEGIWGVDSAQASPLNRAFTDYIADLTAVMKNASQTFTLAFSQELLAPPDANTIGGAWIQRFGDSSTVLTSTGFGTWGSGYVEGVSVGVVQETAHGYLPQYVLSDGTTFYTVATVPDADHYTLVSGAPSVAAHITAQLQTSQCNFNPATTTAYMIKVYKQAAALIALNGTAPALQFGEVGWWFFSGGSGPSMAYYDAYTSDAANTALGRSLATFTTPNDDPSVNSHADANFLVGQLQTHIHAIRVAVLAATPTAKFQMLWPYDVNWPTSYSNMVTSPIGGRLNRYVNLPSAYTAPGSDLDSLKVEALAWGITYRTITNAQAAIKFYATDTTWPVSSISYLVPWSNGGCPWRNEYMQAKNNSVPVNFWAVDHAILLSWETQPLPTHP